MKDPQELIDRAMAGRLDAGEQREWEALLEQRPELQEDVELGRALAALPPPPAVSSNFTALVMQEINRDEPRSAPVRWTDWLRWPRFARLTGTAVVLLGVGAAVTLQQRHNHEQKLAVSVKTLAGGVNIVAANEKGADPTAMVKVFQDFEAIRRLPTTAAPVDTDLLMALRSEE
jgi:hypothetical protein